MSLFTKVLLLIIAQIMVIVGCLYMHLDDFQTQPSIAATEKIESQPFLNKIQSWFHKNTIEEKSSLHTAETELSDKTKEDVKESETKDFAETQVLPLSKTDEVKEEIEPVMNNEVQEKIEKIQTTEPIIKKEVQAEIKKVENIVSSQKALPPKITVEKAVQKEPASASIITDAKVKALFKKKELERNVTHTPLDSKKTNEAIEKEISLIVSKNGIIFKRLSTDISEKSIKTIEKIATILKEHTYVNVEVGGHTDAKGDEDVNAYVSKHRAMSVRDLLIKFGVDAQRLSAKGYGESQPIVKNDPQGYSILNRRVEFKIIKE